MSHSAVTRLRGLASKACAAALVGACLMFTTSVAVAQTPTAISREYQGLRLGMMLSELKSKVSPIEVQDPVIGIYEKFGFGHPKQTAQIDHLLDRRFFEIKQDLPDGVERVSLYFYQSRLYRLGVQYSKAYTGRVDWDHFTADSLLKYGAPTISINVEDAPYFSYTWSDGQTRLKIIKDVAQEKNASRFEIRSYAVVYSDESLSTTVTSREKALEEKLKKGPVF